MKLALALLALSVFAGSDGTAPERKLADLFASAALAPLNRVADLPPDVAERIAWKNGEALFGGALGKRP
jgi:hypothetical protein